MNDRHISDDRLIDICLIAPVQRGGQTQRSEQTQRSKQTLPSEQAHLAMCARCEARRVEIVGILAELDEAATSEAGAVFPDARLERQHARILQRVDHDGRPGRLVAFPAHQSTSTFLMPSRPRVRWAAAGAAAAFIAGVLTGQLTPTFTGPIAATPTQIVANDADQVPLLAVPTTFSEEEFLGQIEESASRNGPAALRPLDAMTPRAWDVR